jgi:acetyl-CoA carboxylase biotin carboxyl carrier protein
VKLNDKVKKGSVLCIIEAMKLMNEIESDVAGTVLAVLAEDGAPVEYDQPLFKIAVA